MIVDPYKGPLYHAKEGLWRNGKKGIFCTGRQEKNIHRGFYVCAPKGKSSWLSPFDKMCCISESEKAKRAEWGGSRYDLNLFHFFNHRLTLIPHISGLSTQWRVHMASFSEMHPNPTSEPYSLHTHACCKLMWCRTRTLGTRRRLRQKSGGELWSSLEHHTSPARQNHSLFLAQYFVPQMHSLFTCVSRSRHSLFFALAQCKMEGWTPSLSPECGALELKALRSNRQRQRCAGRS